MMGINVGGVDGAFGLSGRLYEQANFKSIFAGQSKGYKTVNAF
jgi:hypothetical protein